MLKTDFAPSPSAMETVGLLPKLLRSHRAKPLEQPPSPLVNQMMDMGFPRKHVEFAIKAISKFIFPPQIGNSPVFIQ